MKVRYKVEFSDSYDDLKIEMYMARKGGSWIVEGQTFGNGLSFHYEQCRKLIWPKLDSHRWHNICRDEICQNKVTVLMGCGSSGKTHEAGWTYLLDYWLHPAETCVLVSSTDIRGLRKRVWGEITMLWEQGVERFPYLSGHLLDAAMAITTDDIEDCEPGERKARDMRVGIFAVPCVQGGKFVGLSKFIGIKQKRMRLIADEAAMMGESFLSAFANLNKNEDFRAIIIGNPNDPLDPLGRAAEPKEGWTDDYMEPTKTAVWDTRFMGGRCVNLIGTDSPNLDFPADKPTRYKYLISKEKIQETLSFFQKDSIEYYSQCVGSMKIGTMARRVISRNICRQFNAFDEVTWKGERLTKICGLDAAYGGDRCVCGFIEFGPDVTGKITLRFMPPVIVPIKPSANVIPEDQIAAFVREYCMENGIPPENFFHDSTGRGTLGTAIARLWSDRCNPIEFGGSASDRPVSKDLYIYDEKINSRRLKLCSEHYSNRVAELWYSVRYAIESDSVRNFPQDVMEEMSMREWDWIKGEKKIALETKVDMKLRVGRSPDLGDWASICVEGARQRGFQIPKLGLDSQGKANGGLKEWFAKQQERKHKILERSNLAA